MEGTRRKRREDRKRVARDLRVLRLHMCADCAAIVIVGEGAKILSFASRCLADQGFSGARQRKESGWFCRDNGERPRPVSAILGADPTSVGFDIPTGELLPIADVKMRQNAVPCAA